MTMPERFFSLFPILDLRSPPTLISIFISSLGDSNLTETYPYEGFSKIHLTCLTEKKHQKEVFVQKVHCDLDVI